MALFEVRIDTAHNENLLVVAPDWVLGADASGAFVHSTASDGDMDSWQYDAFYIRNMISSLSRKKFHREEAEIFKDILFKLHCAVNGGSITVNLLYGNLEYFTYTIKRYMRTNIITRKIKYYFPPTKSYKEKKTLLYMMIALQHILCQKSSKLDLRQQFSVKIKTS